MTGLRLRTNVGASNGLMLEGAGRTWRRRSSISDGERATTLKEGIGASVSKSFGCSGELPEANPLRIMPFFLSFSTGSANASKVPASFEGCSCGRNAGIAISVCDVSLASSSPARRALSIGRPSGPTAVNAVLLFCWLSKEATTISCCWNTAGASSCSFASGTISSSGGSVTGMTSGSTVWGISTFSISTAAI